MPRSRTLRLPSPSLVLMVGASGSGKSTLCGRAFSPTRVVSLESCRPAVSDPGSSQDASAAAFDLAYDILDRRLSRGLPTVFDAANVHPMTRGALLRIAARHNLPAVAIVLDLPLEECLARNRARSGRRVRRETVIRQIRDLRAGLRGEPFRAVHRIRGVRAAERIRVVMENLPCDRSTERGPFDIVGDIHGCAAELRELLRHLGYRRPRRGHSFRHPEGRRVIYLGDLVDRGPRIVETVRIALQMVEEGSALAVPGNRDVALIEHLGRRKTRPSPGLARSLQQIDALPASDRHRFIEELRFFIRSLPTHLVLDGGRLAVAHAGLRREFIGRDSDDVRQFALYGETTGAIDRYGLPERMQWAAAYRGRVLLVYGHTPVRTPERINNTINIDTGCVFGGELTALRYPEKHTTSVSALRTYYQSPRVVPTGVGIRAETRILPVEIQGSAATASRSVAATTISPHSAALRPRSSRRIE